MENNEEIKEAMSTEKNLTNCRIIKRRNRKIR